MKAACAGALPVAAHDVLCASSLIPLNKKDGGIRPIAVGDTLRRLVGKVLLRTTPALQQIGNLQPRQCGVGLPFAAELIGMGLQRIAHNCTDDWVALQIDVRNAFNTLDRNAMLRSTLHKAPSLYNWMAWCYGTVSPLYCQGVKMPPSTTGVHQGDAMGPIGFALGLDAALDELHAEEATLPWCVWYLDDGLLVGTLEQITAYLEKLPSKLEAIGLQINLNKCTMWGPGIQRADDISDNIPDSLPIGHPIRSIPVVPYGGSQGITMLGVPCDAASQSPQTTKVWQSAVDNTLTVLDKMRRLPDGQMRHCLIRHCLDACKVNHLMRTTPIAVASPQSQRLSDALKAALCDLVGCGMGAAAWEQATLPIRHGGLGIRDPVKEHGPARLAALANFHARAADVGLLIDWSRHLAPDTAFTITHLAISLAPSHDVISRWSSDATAILSADYTSSRQAWWAEETAVVRRARLPQLGTARDHVRLASQDSPIAAAWLAVSPSVAANTIIPDSDFRSLCRFWLGLPLLEDGKTFPCPLCHDTADPFGDHFVTCKKNGLTRRHNAVRDSWSALFSAASVTHVKEAPSNDHRRPADLLLTAWEKGRDLAVDFTITHPLGADAFPLTLDVGKRHLQQAEHAKQAQERRANTCIAMRWAYQPAAFSPWGGMGPSAKSLYFEATKRLVTDTPSSMLEARHAEIRQALSLSIARQVARQLSLRSRALEELF